MYTHFIFLTLFYSINFVYNLYGATTRHLQVVFVNIQILYFDQDHQGNIRVSKKWIRIYILYIFKAIFFIYFLKCFFLFLLNHCMNWRRLVVAAGSSIKKKTLTINIHDNISSGPLLRWKVGNVCWFKCWM